MKRGGDWWMGLATGLTVMTVPLMAVQQWPHHGSGIAHAAFWLAILPSWAIAYVVRKDARSRRRERRLWLANHLEQRRRLYGEVTLTPKEREAVLDRFDREHPLT